MSSLYKYILVLCLLPYSAWAQKISSSEIDDIVQEVMEVFSVPGMAVGVIKDGETIHSKGYGVRSVNNGGSVDEHTYFGIASNSKGFTATALALLVDDELITWDDPVRKYLPNFQLWDPYISENFTIRDLLSHATGLPLGSGDLMWWPDGNYSPQEVIDNMRHLKPNRGFRTTYEYNNMPFIVAGVIIPAITGKSYEDFLQERIFAPLDMDRCTANTPIMANDQNIAQPHAVLDGDLKQINRYLILDQVVGSIAAAGIECSVDDLLIWADMHLNNGKGLMSAETHATLWQVNTPINVSEDQIKNGTKYRGYGLGYSLSDLHGHRVVSHGGALIGMYSHLYMMPELDVAVAIVTNQQSGASHSLIRQQIVTALLGLEQKFDVPATFKRGEEAKSIEQTRLASLKGNGKPHLALERYTGPYNDPWWDAVDISMQDDGLYFSSRRSPSLHGKLEHFEENTFIVRWADRTHEADAFVYFSMNAKSEITGFTMKAISNRTDFSYDFHHVNMTKQ